MRSRQVRRGRAARTRRYEAAVARQVDLVRHGGQYRFADPREFLRRGDTLDRFGYHAAAVGTAVVYACYRCGLPDLHDGAGDGIGSCDCARCEWCGAAPDECGCDDEDDDCSCGDPGCDHWGPPDRPIETVDTGGLT